VPNNEADVMPPILMPKGKIGSQKLSLEDEQKHQRAIAGTFDAPLAVGEKSLEEIRKTKLNLRAG